MACRRGPDHLVPEWPDDDLAHRITVIFEVPTGPGVEIIAAELLLDVVQRFTCQGLSPTSLRLDIATVTAPPRAQ